MSIKIFIALILFQWKPRYARVIRLSPVAGNKRFSQIIIDLHAGTYAGSLNK